ncbi:CDP-alcohol phosphatidyltransferase family protein [Candidatus Woesearchaeota archaeon]|nr:CDP-alcohol phosphatidyltransferase family protein [Candidatus Woesearchaeota archaeon]
MKLSAADYMTLSRIPLAIVFFFFLDNVWVAFGLLLLIILTDVLDGFIARKMNAVSKLGGSLDPLADKFFIVGTFLVYAILGQISPLVFFLLIVRDIYSVSEMIFIHFTNAKVAHKAGVFGKITTTLQFVLIGVLILNLNFVFPLVLLILISSLLTIYDYLKKRWFS